MAKQTQKIDAYEQITNQIIGALERGIVPWKKPWTCFGMPQNVITKKAYQGLNALILGCSNYSSNVWGTYKQWQDKGGYVRKGEKSTTICFWKFFEKKDENGDTIYKLNGKPETVPMLRTYKVFNACQIENIDLDKYTPTAPNGDFSPIEQAENIVANMPNCPPISHGGNKAYYVPVLDTVQMPNKEQFQSNEDYYGTLFHELGHATGHDSRVGRELSQMKDKYSFEELIAELTACFICSEIGIRQSLDNSAAYIKSWLKVLKDDKKFIVKASSKAKNAAEYILNRQANEKKTETA